MAVNDRKRIFIVGGAGVDIQATSFEKIISQDSNPGKYSVSCGGVGRNVAINASLLGFDVDILCTLGNDTNGNTVLADFNKYGINTFHILTVGDAETSAYMSLHEPDGEMYAAVSSMQINDFLTRAIVETKMELINSCSACFIETNVSAEVLDYITRNCRVKLFLDTVSEHKSQRAKNVIGKFHSIKPNLQEAEILCGFTITSTFELLKAADYFHRKGVENVFISLGRSGVFFSGQDGQGIAVCCNADVKNVTGAGDAFIAGIIHADLSGLSIEGQAIWGTAAAILALSSNECVNTALSSESIKEVISGGGIYVKKF
ncbi:MAG: carbohydrate kinase family protein [Spirochaetes bacterium]|nr:carbohydrate kinase family protein [Spirochaetota bacterium]